jgi:hypothetical protein
MSRIAWVEKTADGDRPRCGRGGTHPSQTVEPPVAGSPLRVPATACARLRRPFRARHFRTCVAPVLAAELDLKDLPAHRGIFAWIAPLHTITLAGLDGFLRAMAIAGALSALIRAEFRD